MTYRLENPSALFSAHQGWPKRAVTLGARMRIKHGVKIARSPVRWVTRQRWASPALRRLKTLDQGQFGRSGFLDVTEDLATKLASIVARWGARCALDTTGVKAPFSVEEVIADESIRSLILDPEVFGTLAKYLGEAPVFSGASIWIGHKNDLYAGSPFFHLDSEGWGNARFYVYLGDVAAGNGPFTYIPLKDSLKFVNRMGYLGKALTDATVTDFFGGDPSISVLGRAGTGFLIDSTRCLHYGSRCTEADRWALIINYRRHSAPNCLVDRISLNLLRRFAAANDPVARILCNAD